MDVHPPVSVWLMLRLGVLDRLAALVLAVALSPVIALGALAVRREDGSPSFVRVQRVGCGFRRFNMWKLRTMSVGHADGRASGSPLTAEDDARITAVGRRLRKYHLDEIPQLVNVAKGDMLLIGPRPEAPEFVNEAESRWAILLRVPPGIAGPTQLAVDQWERRVIGQAAQGNTYVSQVLPVKLALDAWYIEHCSVRTDLQVINGLVRYALGSDPMRSMRPRLARDLPSSVLPWLPQAAGGTPSSSANS